MLISDLKIQFEIYELLEFRIGLTLHHSLKRTN